MRGLITCHLFINSIYSNIKYCFFASKICCLIIIWEYNSYFYFISRMCTDQLLFKIINICTGTDYQICSFTICASTIKCNSVNLSYLINIDLVSICNFKASGVAVASVSSAASVTSGVSVAAASSVGSGVAVAIENL